MDTHVKVLGVLHVAMGALGLIGALLLIVVSAASPGSSPRTAIRTPPSRCRSSVSRERRSSSLSPPCRCRA